MAIVIGSETPFIKLTFASNDNRNTSKNSTIIAAFVKFNLFFKYNKRIKKSFKKNQSLRPKNNKNTTI